MVWGIDLLLKTKQSLWNIFWSFLIQRIKFYKIFTACFHLNSPFYGKSLWLLHAIAQLHCTLVLLFKMVVMDVDLFNCHARQMKSSRQTTYLRQLLYCMDVLRYTISLFVFSSDCFNLRCQMYLSLIYQLFLPVNWTTLAIELDYWISLYIT